MKAFLTRRWGSLDSTERLTCYVMFLLSLALGIVADVLLVYTHRFSGLQALLFLVVTPVWSILATALVWSTVSGFASFGAQSIYAGSNDPVPTTFSEYDALVVRGKWQEAIVGYRELLVVNPQHTHAMIRMSKLLIRNRVEIGEAERLLLAARVLDRAGTHDTEISNALIELYQPNERREDLRRELIRAAQRGQGTANGERARIALRMLAMDP